MGGTRRMPHGPDAAAGRTRAATKRPASDGPEHSLTPEQRRRIAHNRKRALARRRAAKLTSPTGSSLPPALLGAAPELVLKDVICTPAAASVIVWYRSTDLRLSDHAPLLAAASSGAAVIPVFVWPQERSRRGEWSVRGAAEAWLKASLQQLNVDLHQIGSALILRCCGPYGQAQAECPSQTAAQLEAEDMAHTLTVLARETNATSIHFHKSYAPDGQAIDAAVTAALTSAGCSVNPHSGQLLYEPAAVDLRPGFAGGHWGTLMPFLKACQRSGSPDSPKPAPTTLNNPATWPQSTPLDELRLAAVPIRKDGSAGTDWGAAVIAGWTVGEAEAMRLMTAFVSGMHGRGLHAYEKSRGRADLPDSVSRLSPYLRFGQLSPRQLRHAVCTSGLDHTSTKTFSRRLHWRDLAYYQLSCFPEMATRSIRAHYAGMRWDGDASALSKFDRVSHFYILVLVFNLHQGLCYQVLY